MARIITAYTSCNVVKYSQRDVVEAEFEAICHNTLKLSHTFKIHNDWYVVGMKCTKDQDNI